MILPPMTRRRLLLLLTGVALLVYACCFWLVADFTCDDAGIGFCYARSLAQGRGLVLAAGSERSEGYSNLLWVLLLSFGIGHGVLPEVAAKAMALLLGGACVALLCWLPAHMGRRQLSLLDALPGVLLASSAPFVFWTASGLESSLFAFLLLAALAAFTAEIDAETPLPVSSALLLLACLTRPEGPLYALMAIPAVVWAHRRRPLAMLEWIAVIVLGLAAFLAWRWSYFGDWLPLFYYSKMRASAAPLFSAGDQGWAWLSRYFDGVWPLWVTILAATGFVALAQRPAGLCAMGLAAASAIFVLAASGSPMDDRFLAPLLPVVLLALGEGLRRLVEFFYNPDPINVSKDAPTLAAALAVALLMLRLAVPSAGELAVGRGTDTVTFASRVARGEAFARLARKGRLRGATLCEPDAGAAAWASEMPVFGLDGLTDRTLARYGSVPAVRDEYLFEQRRPTFLRLSGVLAATPQLDLSERVARDYVRLPPLPGDCPGDANFVRRSALQARSHPSQIAIACDYGGELTLEGLDRVPAKAAPGGRVELALRWRRAFPSGGVHRVAVELAGPVTLSSEHALLNGWCPARAWAAEEAMRDVAEVALPGEAPEGVYGVRVRVFDATGQELVASEPLPESASVEVTREGARHRCSSLAEGLASSTRGAADLGELRETLRELTLAAALPAPEVEAAREHAALRACRLALEACASGKPEAAVDCVVQSREWGGDATESSQQVSSLLRDCASRLASGGRPREAARVLTRALLANPHDVEAIRARDALWACVAAATPEATADTAASQLPAPTQG
ncbi:MAG: hypothetical protein HY303_11260 [Candidatus Wallbacteria bacterium]|nr:hypothetical protein [Candidatus Wallbacteria bacterium]